MPKSMEMNQSREIIKMCCGDHEINWSLQMQHLKKLLSNYTYEEIYYAIAYYKKNGIELSSLGYFTYGMFKNMRFPVESLKAEKLMSKSGGTSSERNQQRIRQNSETDNRENSDFALFEE